MNSNQIKIVAISDLKTEKNRTDGKKSRQFYTLTLQDAAAPFSKTTQRNIFQMHLGKEGKECAWKTANYNDAKALVGKSVPGSVIRAEVEAYEIEGRTATHYTSVVFQGENTESVFKAAGHKIVGVASPASSVPAEEMFS